MKRKLPSPLDGGGDAGQHTRRGFKLPSRCESKFYRAARSAYQLPGGDHHPRPDVTNGAEYKYDETTWNEHSVQVATGRRQGDRQYAYSEFHELQE